MRKLLITTTIAMMMVGSGYMWNPFKHKPKPIIIYAQTFPFTLHAEISPNPASDNVTSYTFTLDAGTGQVVPPTVVPACNCIKSPTFNINDSNVHTVSALATNQFGNSPTTMITFIVKVPVTPTNITVKPGA